MSVKQDCDSTLENGDTAKVETTENSRENKRKSWRFLAIMIALCVSSLLPALELTVTSTALPTIVKQLGGAHLYVWAVTSYTLSMTVFQPLYGQCSDIFGRRWPMLVAIVVFTLGSGICGGATNMEMLIAGRIIQGIGAGGINVLIEIVVCDLVPLRQRGQYIAMIMGFNALGTAGGPIFGGLIVQHTSWRWVFYLNLPAGGFALLLMAVFLKVNYKKDRVMSQLARIDWLGNSIFICAMVSVLIPLSTASTEYSWSSWHVLVPLLIGMLIGLPLFLLYEGSRFCIEPTMPLKLFKHRQSIVAFSLTFLHALVTISAIYYLPVYFQGVKKASPSRSGVMLIPTFICMLPFVIVGGKLVEMFGRYKPVHIAGLAIMIGGFGLFSNLDQTSSMAEWVIFQIIEAAGVGLVVGVLLPAVQAPLPESDTALSASTWALVRSFGLVWGVAIPSAVFNARFEDLSTRINSQQLVSVLSNGKAYEHATKAFLDSLTNSSIQSEVISVFRDSLKQVWYVSIAFVGLAFVLAFFEQELELRKQVKTEYGMIEKRRATASVSVEEAPVTSTRTPVK